MEKESGGKGCSSPPQGQASRWQSEPVRGDLRLRAGGGRLLTFQCHRKRKPRKRAEEAPAAAWWPEQGQASGCHGNQEAADGVEGRRKRKKVAVSECEQRPPGGEDPEQRQRPARSPAREEVEPPARSLVSAPPCRQHKCAAKTWGRRRGRRRAVHQSDAQTQTEPCPACSCCESSSSPSPDPSSLALGDRSSSSCGSGSSASTSTDSSDRVCPPPSPVCRSTEQRGPGPQDFRQLRPGRGRRPRAPSPTVRRPVCCSAESGRRRKSVRRAANCSPEVARDGWGCLIF
ncbi:uncharacterized protein [Hemitrygon akajei]|uniref:uncharacterized protein n=1 Tax=Hemitrygon akajei TaxID=2704970 RepID=UPI003BF97726